MSSGRSTKQALGIICAARQAYKDAVGPDDPAPWYVDELDELELQVVVRERRNAALRGQSSFSSRS